MLFNRNMHRLFIREGEKKMIILLSKDEDQKLALEGLKELTQNQTFADEVESEIMFQTNLSHEDLTFFVEAYVLSEGKKKWKKTSRNFSHK